MAVGNYVKTGRSIAGGKGLYRIGGELAEQPDRYWIIHSQYAQLNADFEKGKKYIL